MAEDNISSNENNEGNNNDNEENSNNEDDDENGHERIFEEDFTVLFDSSTIENEHKNKYYSIQRSKAITKTNSNATHTRKIMTEHKNLRSRIRRILVGFVIL